MRPSLPPVPTRGSNKHVKERFMKTIDWSTFGITVRDVFRNLHPAKLYEEAIRHEPSTTISSTGALIACSGVKTGRSPKDKRIVRQPDSERDVWWGPVNVAMEQLHFEINRERARDYLNTRERLYVVDGFAGWDPTYRLKIRVIC